LRFTIPSSEGSIRVSVSSAYCKCETPGIRWDPTPGDVARPTGAGKDSPQGVDHEVKHGRGERFPPPRHTPRGISEEGSNLAVDVYCSLSSVDKLHQPVDHHSREPLAEKNLSEELLVHPVIGLLKIKI
jgi:hypothetical protein